MPTKITKIGYIDVSIDLDGVYEYSTIINLKGRLSRALRKCINDLRSPAFMLRSVKMGHHTLQLSPPVVSYQYRFDVCVNSNDIVVRELMGDPIMEDMQLKLMLNTEVLDRLVDRLNGRCMYTSVDNDSGRLYNNINCTQQFYNMKYRPTSI